MPDVQLRVQGAAYGGWKSIEIVRGIEQIAGTFRLGVSERWPDMQMGARQIAPTDRCELSVDGEVIITGYVDDVEPSYAADHHEVNVSGRDATGDLVDCSAIYKSGKWSGRKMEDIAADLAAPFGIQVVTETDTGAAVPQWQIQEGETAFECIERLARERGVLLVSDGKGRLVITRASTQRIATNLVRGENILAARSTLSTRERYSQYTVKGQDVGTDNRFGAQVRGKAVVSDAAIQRYRPLIVLSEDLASGASMKRRVEFERNIRAGRSVDNTITVQGWHHAGGLWQPNRMVHVRDDWLRLDTALLIKQVTFSLSDKGTMTELAVTMREAFDRIPLPSKPNGGDPFWESDAKRTRQRQEDERIKKLLEQQKTK